MHHEVERFVEFFHPPIWVVLSRDDTEHPRRFINHESAEKAARKWRQPGSKRIVKVGPDRERKIVVYPNGNYVAIEALAAQYRSACQL